MFRTPSRSVLGSAPARLAAVLLIALGLAACASQQAVSGHGPFPANYKQAVYKALTDTYGGGNVDRSAIIKPPVQSTIQGETATDGYAGTVVATVQRKPYLAKSRDTFCYFIKDGTVMELTHENPVWCPKGARNPRLDKRKGS